MWTGDWSSDVCSSDLANRTTALARQSVCRLDLVGKRIVGPRPSYDSPPEPVDRRLFVEGVDRERVGQGEGLGRRSGREDLTKADVKCKPQPAVDRRDA